MKDNDLSYKVARVILPVLIYFVAAIIVQAVVGMILIYFDVKSTTGSDVSVSYGYYFIEHMDEIVSRNSMLITLITAIIGIPAMLFMMIRDGNVPKTDVIAKNIRNAGKSVFILIPAGMALSAGVGRLVKFFPLDNIIGSYETSENAIASSPIMLQIASVVVFVPILEEIMFRGVIYNRLKAYSDEVIGVYISALMFGIYHLNLVQGIYAFILGIILASAYRRFNTLSAPIMLHAGANLMALIMQHLWISRAISDNILLGIPVSFVEITAAAVMLILCLKPDDRSQ